MGQRIVDLVGSGDVALFIATPGQLNIQPRIDGAIAAIKKFGKGKIKTTAIATGPHLPDEIAKIDAYYLGHKNLKGMFAVDAGSTQARRPGRGRSTASRRRASRPEATTWGRPRLKADPSGPPGLHDRPAAVSAGLAARPPALLLQLLVRARCPVGHEHRHPVRDEGQREAVPDDEDALRRAAPEARSTRSRRQVTEAATAPRPPEPPQRASFGWRVAGAFVRRREASIGARPRRPRRLLLASARTRSSGRTTHA